MNAPTQPPSGAPTWSRWTSALFGALALLTFTPVITWVFYTWFSGLLGGAAAGIITLPLCLVLTYFAAQRPAWRRVEPNRPGAEALFVAAIIGVILGLLYARGQPDRLIFVGVLMPIVVWGWVWGAFGFVMARALTLPIFFSLFSLPWEHFLRGGFDQFLQEWSADIAVYGLSLFDYDLTYWNLYTFYSKKFYVIVNETCSGMNMLVTLSMYTVIFTWLTQPSIKKRLLVLLMVYPISLFFNGLRISVIFLMGHHSGKELAMGFWHTGSAYILFIPVFYLIYAVNELLKGRPRARA